jgi:hypothetical protein
MKLPEGIGGWTYCGMQKEFGRAILEKGFLYDGLKLCHGVL